MSAHTFLKNIITNVIANERNEFTHTAYKHTAHRQSDTNIVNILRMGEGRGREERERLKKKVVEGQLKGRKRMGV